MWAPQSLRLPATRLARDGPLPSDDFCRGIRCCAGDTGTNLLPMYMLLGERFAGWPGALSALAIGTFVPATIAVALGGTYVAYDEHP